MRKHAILGGFGFGVLMIVAYFLMDVSPGVVILAGLGSGFLFGLAMFIVAIVQAREKRSWDQADARANKDIMLQLVFGSVVAVASIVCAIRVQVPSIGIWIFVGILGLAKVGMSFGRMREIHGRRKLGEILIEAGIITEDELNKALEEQRKKPDKNG